MISRQLCSSKNLSSFKSNIPTKNNRNTRIVSVVVRWRDFCSTSV